MYLIPLAMVVVLALIAAAWAPLFALIVAVPLFGGFLIYVAMRPRADETAAPPTESAAAESGEGGERPRGTRER